MGRDAFVVVGLLLLSGAAAVTSNTMRSKPLPWVREPLAEVTAGSQPTSRRSTSSKPATTQSTSQPTSAPVAADKPGIIRIDAVIDHLRAQDATLVDARETHEYVEGHFRGAVHLPSSDIYNSVQQKGFLNMVPTESLVIVYCGGGDCEASHNVADALRRDFEYKNVLVYEKGWAEVMQSGRLSEFIEQGTPP